MSSYNNVFDRLSQTETHSSSSKKPIFYHSDSHELNTSTASVTSARSSRSQRTNRSTATTRTAPSSLFHRLATSDTYASASRNGKMERNEEVKSKGKTTDGFFARMAASDTFASADMKGRRGEVDLRKGEETHSKLTAGGSKKGGGRKSHGSSNGKSSRANDAFFNRMAYEDTFASADMKGKRSEDPTPSQSSSQSHSKSKRMASNGFFDRLAVSDTFASATMKGKIEPSPSGDRPETKVRTKSKASEGFFDRMANTETASTRRRKHRYGNENEGSYDNGRPSTAKSASSKGSVLSRQTLPSFAARTTKVLSRRSLFQRKAHDKALRSSTADKPEKKNRTSIFSRRFKSNKSNKSNKPTLKHSKSTGEASVRSTNTNTSIRSTTNNSVRSATNASVRSSATHRSDAGSVRSNRSNRSLTNRSVRSNKSNVSRTSRTSATSKTTTTSFRSSRTNGATSSVRSSGVRARRVNVNKKEMPSRGPSLVFPDDDELSFGESEGEEEEEENLFGRDDASRASRASKGTTGGASVRDAVMEEDNGSEDKNPSEGSSQATPLPPQDRAHTDEEDPNNESMMSFDDDSSYDKDEKDLNDILGTKEHSLLGPREDSSTEGDVDVDVDYLPLDEELSHDADPQCGDSKDGSPEVDATSQHESVTEDPSVDGVMDHHEEVEEEHEHVPEDESVPDDEHMQAGSKYTLLCSDKYSPEKGLFELDIVSLGLIDPFLSYESNGCTSEELSVAIIEALFRRDFTNGEHWDIDPGTARELEDDEGDGRDLEGRAFIVKQQARWDSSDNYSVAAAKGMVTFWPEEEEIHLENYSYFAAG